MIKFVCILSGGGNAAAILSVRFLYIGITYTEFKIIDINYEPVFL